MGVVEEKQISDMLFHNIPTQVGNWKTEHGLGYYSHVPADKSYTSGIGFTQLLSQNEWEVTKRQTMSHSLPFGVALGTIQ